jgi:acyl transferase domain-containing protein
MESTDRAIAIVGLGAVLPDAPDVASFWNNLKDGRYSICETPQNRWDAALYYDADPRATDKTYSKIGGWVKDWEWEPLKWRLPIPPKVADAMDLAQKWAITTSRQALADFGYPDRPLDPERTAVIFGNALGGDFHLLSAARILFPEFGEELAKAPSFQTLPPDVRGAVMEELLTGVRDRLPDITEDTMPGELANIVAGRVAALYDFRGPNYVADAACASAMAAISAAVEGLEEHDYDAVLTGGIDANMSPSTFVKFCKIGALSATGTRPYADGADGFVMGEGAACFLLKRLADAERDGDRVYAVIRGLGGSSDGRGKGITAPNPAGQQLAIRRAWERARVAPEPGDLVEGHGTSTKVGDVVEVDSLTEVFGGYGLPAGSIMLGSVKSNIGHLKGAAGAAGLLKVTLALHEKQAPPSVNFNAPNPNIDFSSSPLRVNDELRAWEKPTENGPPVRRAGVSAFGFGGTNFHAVLEEHVPGRLKPRGATIRGAELAGSDTSMPAVEARAPLRGALVIGAATQAEIASKLRAVQTALAGGTAPRPIAPLQSDLDAEVRLAIDYGDADDLSQAIEGALKALDTGETGRWRALRNKGVYIGQGSTGKIAFLFTGQGSQYVNMLRELRDADEVVRRTFDEADEVMAPLLDGPLTDRIFVDPEDEAAVAGAEQGLKQTAITQPAVLTVDTALARLFGAYGIEPDMVMGHSLGEYGALVAAGALPFGDALTAVAARGRAMTDLSVGDNGGMAAVFAPPSDVEAVLDRVDGYVVVANLNSTKECVIGGATEALVKAVEALTQDGMRVVELPVSHAFHTNIVEPAAAPLMEVLRESGLRPPEVPVVANVSGDFYPSDPDARDRMVEILGAQIGSPVQFVRGLNTLHDSGARVFIEMGPKRALYGMATDVLGERDGVTTLFTNHPRTGGVVSMNRALCAAYALGLGRGRPAEVQAVEPVTEIQVEAAPPAPAAPVAAAPAVDPAPPTAAPGGASTEDRYVTLGRMFADFLDKSVEVFNGEARAPDPVRVGITGASLGLPGPNRVFDDSNVPRILGGDQFITHVPVELRQAQADKRITRLVKGANGEARFETIDDPADVIKLAGRGGSLDLPEEFGYPADRMPALDRVTELAIAAGIEALRDAGIPLVMRYKTTTTGSKLPAGWALPEEMQDDTGIIFGSAFPGYDAYAEIIQGFEADQARRGRLEELESLRAQIGEGDSAAMTALDARITELRAEVEKNPFHFDRRFLFRVLSMGHSQFAEFIGARGPNTQLNAACASGTQAVGLARDWIEAGRCRRVIVITADDVTTDRLFPWFSSGFLASGAAATDERVEDAAIPFDRRRHGMIIGMGGAALVVEDLQAAAERGVDPICEVLGAITANSAYHGTRLNVDHIAGLMERLVSDVEARWGLDRRTMARHTVFVSHETYTPARGGSASAEVHALRHVFGDAADAVVVANTKGYTGHPMGVGIEDALAVKMLETGVVPPVANFREVDPDLGLLNLSRGGDYPIHYALRLGAGFGSQISMSLVRWTPPPDGARRDPEALGFRHRLRDPGAWQSWLSRATGYDAPEVEIDRRTLRVRDEGPPAREPARAPLSTGAVVTPPPAAPTRAGTRAARGDRRDRGTGSGRGTRRGGSRPDAGPRHRRRADGLPARHARHGPRPRGRPRHRPSAAPGTSSATRTSRCVTIRPSRTPCASSTRSARTSQRLRPRPRPRRHPSSPPTYRRRRAPYRSSARWRPPRRCRAGFPCRDSDPSPANSRPPGWSSARGGGSWWPWTAGASEPPWVHAWRARARRSSCSIRRATATRSRPAWRVSGTQARSTGCTGFQLSIRSTTPICSIPSPGPRYSTVA